MANAADTLQRAYDNYARLWLMCTEIIASGSSQTAIDALTSAAEGSGIPAPKINSSVDGDSYDWVGYQSMLGKIMTDLRQQMIMAAGPFAVVTRARY